MENIIGKRIGLYDVLYECGHRANDGHKLYRVRCSECGFETDMLKSKIAKTTKCTHLNVSGNYKKYHTYTWSNHRIGKIFYSMIDRCYNENNKSYRWYGQKGITVCTEWLSNPKSFEEWAVANGYNDNLTIDRKKENKDYCPENCRWITMNDNSKYKSTTRLIEVDEETHTGREWASILDIGTNVINNMLRSFSEEQVKEFIRSRKKDKTKHPSGSQSWMQIYGIV